MFTFKNSDHFLVVLAKVFVKGWDRSRALIFPPPYPGQNSSLIQILSEPPEIGALQGMSNQEFVFDNSNLTFSFSIFLLQF